MLLVICCIEKNPTFSFNLSVGLLHLSYAYSLHWTYCMGFLSKALLVHIEQGYLFEGIRNLTVFLLTTTLVFAKFISRAISEFRFFVSTPGI